MSSQCQLVNKQNCECAWPGATAVLCKSIAFVDVITHPRGCNTKCIWSLHFFLDIIPHDKIQRDKCKKRMNTDEPTLGTVQYLWYYEPCILMFVYF